ncbi:MAG: methionine--tRNA ligase subunit beta, partial [Luteimonas sp.]
AKSGGGVDDLDLNLTDFIARVNADLVGKFVNLASRCAGFIEKRFDGRLAARLPEPGMYVDFVARLAPVRDAYERNDPASVLRLTMTLADEANRYIDDRKPWVIAKQDGADAELQWVCTQGLNLFRVLAAALKPVLPRVASQVESFLDVPVDAWSDLDTPLLARKINPYAPLFTRIDPKHIEAMTEASTEDLKPATALVPPGDFLRGLGATSVTSSSGAGPKNELAAEAAPATAGSPSGMKGEFIAIDDFAKFDLRIGKVLACEFVAGSDKLLRFELDAGELGTRQIFSGIRASYGEPGTLVGRNVVFIANLAPRKMRFGVSEGMILSAGFDGGGLHLLDVGGDAAPGMPVK